MGDMQPAAGSLLIASATLVDPNFARCVLLILDSNDDGSLGVILNQPTETPVDEVLDQWHDVVNPPGVFFRGGPVELNAALAIGSVVSADDATARLAAGLRVARAWWTSTGRPTTSSAGSTGLRIYAGYAGWGAGQLDAELAEGSWHVVPAQHGDLFSDRPDRLWREILRRQPPPLSMLATLPEDASLN